MGLSISRLIILVIPLFLLGAQCISFGGKGEQIGAGGGIFKSLDKGGRWIQKTAVPTASGVKNFSSANVIALAIDPQDHLAIYTGTRESGLFYSYDGGESWNQPGALKKGFVAAIAIDPKNKCVVYAAYGNQIMKTEDCSRSYKPVYNESAADTFITALSINPLNSSVIYAGTAKGALVISADSGKYWSTLGNNLRGKVADIVINPKNSSVVYAAVVGRGLWKSENGGETFADLSDKLKNIKDGKDARRLLLDKNDPDTIILASRNKLVRSTDGGLTWTSLPILTPETIEILAATINPNDSKEIYYGTATTFYRSVDGGEKWFNEKLPTKRQSSALLVDSVDPKIIYLGALEVKK